MNGGMLAKKIQEKGAELIGFNISDAVGTAPTGDISVPYEDYENLEAHFSHENDSDMGGESHTVIVDDEAEVFKKLKIADK